MYVDWVVFVDFMVWVDLVDWMVQVFQSTELLGC